MNEGVIINDGSYLGETSNLQKFELMNQNEIPPININIRENT